MGRNSLSCVFALVLCVAIAAQSSEPTRGPGGIAVDGKWVRQEDVPQVGEYYALVVGIDDYEDKALLDLRCAVKDATEVAKVLREDYGFRKVILLLNEQATDEAVWKAFGSLKEEVTERDSVLIYYAGHGVCEGGLGYWIPVNGERSSDARYLEHTSIRGRLTVDWLGARHVLIVSDSCYGAALFRSGEQPPDVIPEYVQEAMRTPSRQCLTSGGVCPVPDGLPGSNSVFCRYFLDALKRHRRDVFVTSDFFAKLRENVNLNAPRVPDGTGELRAQNPQLGVLHEAGHQVGGEFVFFRRKRGPGAIAVPRIEPPPAIGSSERKQPTPESAPEETSRKSRAVLYGTCALVAIFVIAVAATKIRKPPVPLPPPMDAAKLVVPMSAGPSRKIFLFGKRHVTFGREGTGKGTNDISLRLLPTGEEGSPNWKATEKMSRNQGVFECRDDGLYLRRLGEKGLSVDGQAMAGSEMKLPDECCVSVAEVLDLRIKAHRSPSTGKLVAARIARVENAENHEYVMLNNSATLGPKPDKVIALPLSAGLVWRDGIFTLKLPRQTDVLLDGKKPRSKSIPLHLTQTFQSRDQTVEFHAIAPEDFKTL